MCASSSNLALLAVVPTFCVIRDSEKIALQCLCVCVCVCVCVCAARVQELC